MPTRATQITLLLLLAGTTAAHAQTDQQARGRQAIQAMAGCYLVDYSYVEVPQAGLYPGSPRLRRQPRQVGEGVDRRAPAGRPPRFVKMFEVEDDAMARNLADPAVREAVRQRILAVIEDYRAR